MTETHILELNSAWSFWLSLKLPSKSYFDSLQKLMTFASLNQFSSIWKGTPLCKLTNFFINPERAQLREFEYRQGKFSQIEVISLFREYIQPSWEDPLNRDGAQITAVLFLSLTQLDELYRQLIFLLIGQTLSFSEFLCGVRFCDRTKLPCDKTRIKLQIWVNSDQKLQKLSQSVGRELKQKLKHFEPSDKMLFRSHRKGDN